MISLENFLTNLDAESVEGKDLLKLAPKHQQYFQAHFHELKEAYRLRVSNNGHYQEYKYAPYHKQMNYLSNCLRDHNVAAYLAKQIDDTLKNKAIEAKKNPQYPYDTFLPDGRRICNGTIIPDNAPPRPSVTAKWIANNWVDSIAV